jgi:UDP-N-acetyl-D-mannosaminuronic acid dehydrogenase
MIDMIDMTKGSMSLVNDVVVIGGCGRAGLPLGLAFADSGLSVTLLDVNTSAIRSVNAGVVPFREAEAGPVLERMVEAGRLSATDDPSVISTSRNVVVCLTTGIDEYLNPDPHDFLTTIRGFSQWFVDGQLLVLRSTVFPGVTTMVNGLLADMGKAIDVAFCPERIAEGHAISELRELPEIIGGCTPVAAERADALFRKLTPETQHLSPEEAELAKLFCNSWRYLKFAVANQLFMMANDFGVDYERIRAAVSYKYPRAADLPSAGFVAGPCLFKDTMQLAAFNNNNFMVGHASMLVNEGLPQYLMTRLAQQFDISKMTVGILGMAFKAESDDTRSSLSYKLKRILQVRAADVLCTDPYVTTDTDLIPLEQLLNRADLLIIGAPHRAYADIQVVAPIVDIWNLRGNGVCV